MKINRILAAFGVALFALAASSPASATDEISKPSSYLSAATTNSTLIYGNGATLSWIVVGNTTATTYYLKLYNESTAPACGTDTPFMRIPIPAGLDSIPIDGAQFPIGIGFCLTGALADADTTPAATGVALNFGVVPQ